jgi:hypothetical protein
MTAAILRSKRHGAFRLRTTHWGSYLSPCDDPDGIEDFKPEEVIKEFHIPETLHRIPADLWQRWIQLCFHFAPKTVGSSLEVGVRLLVSATDPSKYKILVPRQSVSGGSVHATNFDDSCDIVTGEVITSYPPDGWIPCGSSHSHGTMAAFFSTVDDNNELGDPGLHITIGKINNDPAKMTYELVASVTADRRRYRFDYNKVVDSDPVDVAFHPNCLEFVKAERPPATVIPGLKPNNYAANGTYGGYGGSRGYGTTSYSGKGNSTTSRPYRKGRRVGFDGLDDIDDKPFSWTPGARGTLSAYVIENALQQASLEDLLEAVSDWLTAAIDDPDSLTAGYVCAAYKELISTKDLLDETQDLFMAMATENVGIFSGPTTDATEATPATDAPGRQLLLTGVDTANEDGEPFL